MEECLGKFFGKWEVLEVLPSGVDRRINLMKSHHTQNDFVEICKKIAIYHQPVVI